MWLAAAIFLLSSFPGAVPVQAQGPTGERQGSVAAQNQAFELEVIRLINVERVEAGLHPLRRNDSLIAAARIASQDMRAGLPLTSAQVRACDQGFIPYEWDACYVEEVVNHTFATPNNVVLNWINNPNDRGVLLDSYYREIGVGYAAGGPAGHYWAADLGSEPFILPVFINDDADQATSSAAYVTLTREEVSGQGSMGDITGVKISEDPSFQGAAWQDWDPRPTFTLSTGNGNKTVYVLFTDGEHQVTSSDSICAGEPCGFFVYLPLVIK
jgi:uncharacterized protein YkwD